MKALQEKSKNVLQDRLQAQQPEDASRTRERIVCLLKTRGPCTAAQLSKELLMTAMGVRRHLSQLEMEGLVQHAIEPQQRGRPTHRYSLTSTGDDLFPRRYDNLAQCLMELIVELDGEDKLKKILQLRMERQMEAYRQKLAGLNLQEKVLQLAKLRDEEGFMGKSEVLADGSFLLSENNCALHDVARSCPAVCESEFKMFSSLIPEAEIHRLHHITDGSQFCVYKIEPRCS